MRKISILIILTLLCIINSFTLNRDYVSSSPESISLENEQLYMLYFGDDDIIEVASGYEILNKEMIPFIKIESNEIDFVFLYSDNFAFLSNDNYGSSIMINSNSVSNRVFAYIETWGFTPVKSINASSTYIENGSDYSINNTQKTKLNPWVEGVDGSGIGEKINIDYEQGEHLSGIKYILFSNGFVSYKDPSLYLKNNRVKKIKVISKDQDYEIEIDIEDTPNIQELYLPQTTNEIEIEILDIYKGSKWDDTCINLLVGIKEDPKLEELININK